MTSDKNSIVSSNSGQILDDELASKINNALDDVSSDSDDDLSAQFRSLSQQTLSETTVSSENVPFLTPFQLINHLRETNDTVWEGMGQTVPPLKPFFDSIRS